MSPLPKTVPRCVSIEIDALYLIASVLGCGIERDGEAQSGVQTFATQRETAFECLLF